MAFHKYLTFSFDDGLEQDKKIIQLMKQYGLKGTFNLNAGLLGKKNWVGRIGNVGFTEYDSPGHHRIVKVQEHFRIPEDEISQVYEGFEVASHAYYHENLRNLSEQELDRTIGRDIEKLSALVGYPVVGHAYPGGLGSRRAQVCLKRHGIIYGRNAFSKGCFSFPENPLDFHPTCSWKDKNVMELLEQFLHTSADQEDLLFLVWGHGYEMDYNTPNASQRAMEHLFARAAGREDIVYCSNKEAFIMHDR